jgi:hypothetical protein
MKRKKQEDEQQQQKNKSTLSWFCGICTHRFDTMTTHRAPSISICSLCLSVRWFFLCLAFILLSFLIWLLFFFCEQIFVSCLVCKTGVAYVEERYQWVDVLAFFAAVLDTWENNLKGGKVLAQSSRGFSPWWAGFIAVGPRTGKASWWGACSGSIRVAGSMVTRKQGGEPTSCL